MRRRIALQSPSCEMYATGPMVVATEFVRLAADRLAMIQEAADAINRGNDHSIIVVGGRISELVDFVYGNYFPLKIPPGHQPHPRLRGQELVLMGGAELVRYSKAIANEKLVANLQPPGKSDRHWPRKIVTTSLFRRRSAEPNSDIYADTDTKRNTHRESNRNAYSYIYANHNAYSDAHTHGVTPTPRATPPPHLTPRP